MATQLRAIVAISSDKVNQIAGLPGVILAQNFNQDLFGTPTLPFPNYALIRLQMHWATFNNLKNSVHPDAIVWTDAAHFDKNTVRMRAQKFMGTHTLAQPTNGNHKEPSWADLVLAVGTKAANSLLDAGVNTVGRAVEYGKEFEFNSIDGIGPATASKLQVFIGGIA